MMFGSLASWIETAGPLLTVLTPLVAVPLTVITFYLRSLREHQVMWHAALVRRVEAGEKADREIRRGLSDLERDYATTEEWLRECMHTSRVVEHLTEVTTRMEAIWTANTPDKSSPHAVMATNRTRRAGDTRTDGDLKVRHTGV